jgi:alkane 1-monooxygenase
MTENKLEKPESWMWHLLGFLIPGVAITGNILGEWWVISGTVLALGIFPILDFLLGEDNQNREVRTNGVPFEVMLYIHAILMIPLIWTVCWRGQQDGSAWTTWAAVISTGIATGISGIVVGHEMGHKKPKTIGWWMGRATLVSLMYSHFTTEHNYNHHKFVATVNDSASAPKGRNLWFHVFQTVPLQFISAWRIQAKRSKSFLHNSILHGVIVQIVFAVAIWYFFGTWGLGALLFLAAISIFLLEYVNYIRHYGLRRDVGERQTKMHSWQSRKRLSRWVLIELTLHPAHHLKASEPFWKLQPYEGAPNLPTGYFGLFWPSLIPPLWRRLMDHRIPE